MAVQTVVDSPWEEAVNAQLPALEIYGKATVDAWFCVLVKGVGAIPFDPTQHKVQDRRTMISLAITPLPDMGLRFDTERRMLAQSSEWVKIVKPSLEALGIGQPQSLNSKYVRAALVSTGRTYVNKNGETKDATTIKVLEVFDTEAACLSAWQATTGTDVTTHQAAPVQAAPVTMSAPVPAANNEKAVALKFAAALVANVKGDRNLLAAAIAGNPLLSRNLTVDSPEVVNLINDYLFQHLATATA